MSWAIESLRDNVNSDKILTQSELAILQDVELYEEDNKSAVFEVLEVLENGSWHNVDQTLETVKWKSYDEAMEILSDIDAWLIQVYLKVKWFYHNIVDWSIWKNWPTWNAIQDYISHINHTENQERLIDEEKKNSYMLPWTLILLKKNKEKYIGKKITEYSSVQVNFQT